MLSAFMRMRRRLEMHRGHAIKIFIGWLLVMAVTHVVLMVAIEEMGIFDAIWYTAVTATTTGYGDISPKTIAGRSTTMVIMFAGSIYVLAALASLLFERAADRRERKKISKWRWNMDGHILIVSTTGTEQVGYLVSLIRQIKADPDHAGMPVMVMTHGFDVGGLPDQLADLGVVYVRGDGDSDHEMTLGSVARAGLVVVLGDDRTIKADALVFDVVSRVRDTGFTGRIVSECEDDRNRRRLSIGRLDACVRPARGYPEMLARAVVAPGSEQVIEEIFTFGGVECEYVDLGGARHLGDWRSVVSRVMQEDLDTPIAYRLNADIVTAPPSGAVIKADGLYVLMGQEDQEMRKTKLALLLAA